MHVVCTETQNTFSNNSWNTNGPNGAVAHTNRLTYQSAQVRLQTIGTADGDLQKTSLTWRNVVYCWRKEIKSLTWLPDLHAWQSHCQPEYRPQCNLGHASHVPIFLCAFSWKSCLKCFFFCFGPAPTGSCGFAWLAIGWHNSCCQWWKVCKHAVVKSLQTHRFFKSVFVFSD